jgi:hypothetical protein
MESRAVSKPAEVREDAAVLSDLLKRHVVEDRNQRLLVEQGPELTLGPEPPGDVCRCKERDWLRVIRELRGMTQADSPKRPA